MKARLCYILICCVFLSTMLLPISAGDAPALALAQTDTTEPGQDVTLTLSLPDLTLAGGFMTLTYDASLFTLKNISLLQATDALTLTYHDKGGSVNLLLDSAQNTHIDGAFLSLTFACSEEAQPGAYAVMCTVPDAASFYTLNGDGSTTPLQIGGCHGQIVLTDPPLPPCPVRYLACQETNPSNGKIHVRLCALVESGAALSRGSYGFVCAVTDKDGTRELTLGGSDTTDHIEGGGNTYTADELGGSIFFVTLTVPATGNVSITLTPYVSLDGQSLHAGTYTVTYSDGAYVGTTN